MKDFLRLFVLCLFPICIHAQTNDYTTIRAPGKSVTTFYGVK